MTFLAPVPEQRVARRPLDRRATFQIGVLALLAVVTPVSVVARLGAGPVSVSLAAVAGTYLATVAVYVWALGTSPVPDLPAWTAVLVHAQAVLAVAVMGLVVTLLVT